MPAKDTFHGAVKNALVVVEDYDITLIIFNIQKEVIVEWKT
jgi:hypothetical protein